MKLKKINPLGVWIYLICIGFFFFIVGHAGFNIWVNKSDSLNGKLFLKIPTKYPNIGDIVAIEGHVSDIKSPKNYIKRLAGQEGDRIYQTSEALWVNYFVVNFFEDKTKEGDPLTRTRAEYIPEGKVFVISDAPRSFDSRYEEFGFVDAKNITGVLWRIY